MTWMLHCVSSPQSQIIFCHLATPHPPSFWYPPYCCLRLWVSVLYPTYEWNQVVLRFFWLILLSMRFSRSMCVVTNGSISPVLIAEQCPILYAPHLLHTAIHQRALWVRHHEWCCRELQGAHTFANKGLHSATVPSTCSALPNAACKNQAMGAKARTSTVVSLGTISLAGVDDAGRLRMRTIRQ